MTHADTIRRMLAQLNAAWPKGSLAAVESMFAEDVVFVAPGFSVRMKGRKPCLDSYREFVQKTGLRRFTPGRAVIDVCGQTAVAVCPFEIEYTMNGRDYRERGNDVFVLACTDRWRFVWRTMTAEPMD
jgi:ketosteroid isomerase-like protein